MERGQLEGGSLFAGNYRIERVLRQGELSVTYVARSERNGKARALEVVRIDLRAKPELHERFTREAKSAARIESEHVGSVFDAGVDEQSGAPWLELELLEGESLAARIERAKLSADEAQDLVAQLGHGLSAAHRLAIVHGDFKPESIFLSKHWKAGRPFLASILDFGVARFISEARAVLGATASMTTPVWMAPEQSEAGKALTPATDVWALGLVMFRALTGKHYWSEVYRPGSNMASILMEVLARPLVAASQRARELGVEAPLPAAFDAWFSRCVDRDASRRFQDAAAAASAFDAGAHTAGPAPFEPRNSPAAGTVMPSQGELTSRTSSPSFEPHAPSQPHGVASTEPIAPMALPAGAATVFAPPQPVGAATVFAPPQPAPQATMFAPPQPAQTAIAQATMIAPGTSTERAASGAFGISGTMVVPPGADLRPSAPGVVGPSGTFVAPSAYGQQPAQQHAQQAAAFIPVHPSAQHPVAQDGSGRGSGSGSGSGGRRGSGGGSGSGIAIAILSVLGLGFGGLVVYELVHSDSSSTTTTTTSNDTESTRKGVATTSDAPGAASASNAFVRVDPPPGEWLLGVDSDDATPLVRGFRPSRHVVAPSSAFELQQHEVTWGELDAFLAAAPESKFPAPAGTPSDPDKRNVLPATGVPWPTAVAYCASISAALPTEEQWELAARGPQRRKYAWGDAPIDLATTHAFAGSGARVKPVMTNAQDRTPGADASAIFDLMGNAQEWTEGLYRDDFPAADETWTQGTSGASFRTLRGFPLGEEPFPETMENVTAARRQPACATGPCAAPGASESGDPPLLTRLAFVESGAGMSGATKPIFQKLLVDAAEDIDKCLTDRNTDDAITKVVFSRATKAQSTCVDSDGYAADPECCNEGNCSYAKSDPLKVTVANLADPAIPDSSGLAGACVQKVIESRLAPDAKPAPVKWPDDADAWTAIVWTMEVRIAPPAGFAYVGFRCARGVK